MSIRMERTCEGREAGARSARLQPHSAPSILTTAQLDPGSAVFVPGIDRSTDQARSSGIGMPGGVTGQASRGRRHGAAVRPHRSLMLWVVEEGGELAGGEEFALPNKLLQ